VTSLGGLSRVHPGEAGALPDSSCVSGNGIYGTPGQQVVDPAADEPPGTYNETPLKLEVLLQPPALVVPEPVPPARQCPAGHDAPVPAKFCPECGAALSGSQPPAEPPGSRPKPDALLTPQERAERERAHAAALAAGARDPGPAPVLPPSGRTVLVHLVEDGLTAFGTVWMRGQEIEVAVGGPRWADASRWILLNDRGQMQRYGRVMFRPGPWPGLGYAAAAGQFQQMAPASGDAPVTGPTLEQLQQAQEAERRRGRGVPAPSLR